MNRVLRGWLITGGIFVVSLGVGALVGKIGRGESPVGKAGAAESSEKRKLSALSGGKGRYASDIVARAAELEDQDATWRMLLRELPLEEFPEMAEMMVGRYRSSSSLRVFSERFGDLLEIWGERDPSAAVAWYEDEMPKELDGKIRENLFLGWGKADGESALAYIEDRVKGEWLGGFLSQAFAGVGESNPELTTRLLGELSERGYTQQERFDIWPYACFSLGRYHPDAGFEYLASLPDHAEGKSHCFEALFGGIRDGATALRLWESFAEDDSYRLNHNIRIRLIGDRVASSNVPELLEWYSSGLDGDPYGARHFVDRISVMKTEELFEATVREPGAVPLRIHQMIAAVRFSNTFHYDTDAARAIYAEILSAPGSEEHTGYYMEALASRRDRDELADHVVSELGGDARIRAAASYAGAVASRSPEQALQWMRQQHRDELIVSAAQIEIARNWPESESLSQSGVGGQR